MLTAKYVLLIAAALLTFSASAESIGKITHLGGVLHVTRADGKSKMLSVKSEVEEGDVLRTEANTFARIKFKDGGEMILRPGTVFKVSMYSFEADESAKEKDGVVMNLVKGGVRSVTGLMGKRSPEKFKLETPVATIGVRGTDFQAVYCMADCGAMVPGGEVPPQGLFVNVVTGVIEVSNGGGQQQFASGQFGYVPSTTQPPVVLPSNQTTPDLTIPQTILNNNANGAGLSGSGSLSCRV